MKLNVLVVFILIAISLVYVSARGRGGGGGGRSFGRSGSRISRGSSFSGSRYSTYKTALAVGAIYGISRYRFRYGGSRYYTDDPSVCYNTQYKKTENGTTYSGYFVCPDGSDHSADYCCGSDSAQYCCTFWDSPGRKAGAIIGIILAVLVPVSLIACCVCCCVKSNAKKRAQAKPPTVITSQPYSNPGYRIDNDAPPPYPAQKY